MLRMDRYPCNLGTLQGQDLPAKHGRVAVDLRFVAPGGIRRLCLHDEPGGQPRGFSQALIPGERERLADRRRRHCLVIHGTAAPQIPLGTLPFNQPFQSLAHRFAVFSGGVRITRPQVRQ